MSTGARPLRRFSWQPPTGSHDGAPMRALLPLLLTSLLLGTLFVTYHLVKHLGLRVDYV